jgi:hypothetical protein
MAYDIAALDELIDLVQKRPFVGPPAYYGPRDFMGNPLAPRPFDGCSTSCRPRNRPWQHTFAWGLCAHAPESARPQPTVSLLGTFRAEDGETSIAATVFTVPQLAARVEEALRTVPVRFGPGALAMLGRGETVGLSGGEYGAMALAVAMMLTEEGNR